MKDKKQHLCRAGLGAAWRDVDDAVHVVARVVHAVAAGLDVIVESAQIPRAM